MKKLGYNLESAGILVSTTVGAGVFSLPYLFQKSGWGAGALLLLALGAAMAASHGIYWECLARDKTDHLLSLVRRHLGRLALRLGTVSILAGLVLTLVVYLILGAQFVLLVFPAFEWRWALILFWLLAVFPFFLKLKRIILVEMAGAFLIAALMSLIFFMGIRGSWFAGVPFFVAENALFPFGAVLFALAGWTAIGPMHEHEKRLGTSGRKAILLWGTGVVVGLYLLFVVSVFNISSEVTPDTLSGLFTLPRVLSVLMGALGIFCIWTSYVPIGLEARESLVEDVEAKGGLALFAITFLPLFLVALGLNDFLRVMSLAGGVFLSLQYILILLVGRKMLAPQGARRLGFDALLGVFLLGALYEVYYFLS